MSSQNTTELLDSLSTLTDSVKDEGSKEAMLDTVERFARSMQRKIAKLGGVAAPAEAKTDDIATARFSYPSRNSLSNSLDGYRPGRDVVAPISVRPVGMELLWVCGDCGEHYPRSREAPDRCTACGAPKQHFYAPIED
jgi:rubrerythrin